MLWHRMHAVSATGSPMLIDDVTGDRSTWMDCGAYRALLSAQTHPNAAKLIDGASPCRWIMDNDPKHTFLRASYSKEMR